MGFLRRLVAVVVVVALCGGWGTLANPIALPADDEAALRGLIRDYGLAPDAMLATLDNRSGPHPIHQFIAYQAWLLLKDDPAYADGHSGFPTGDEINAWDGIERIDGVMMPIDNASHLPSGLGPIPGSGVTGGPSADAEATPKGFNKLYNGRAHYYNPWLDDGDAPKLAAHNFVRLVAAIAEQDAPSQRAHFAAYMAHYLGDVTSAKHADAFTLDGKTVARMVQLADAWHAEAGHQSLYDRLKSHRLAEAERLLRTRVSDLNHGVSDAYWARVDGHIALIGGTTQFRRGTLDGKVDIPESSMLTATACYLHALHERAPGQSLDQFFTYFDPFYFNGPIPDPIVGEPKFKMCTPFGEHLHWETNPAHYKTVLDFMAGGAKTMLWADGARGNYRPLARTPEWFVADQNVARPAMETTIKELTKACSRAVHGDIGSEQDFKADHEANLKMAIQCVYTAFRASITALRVEAAGRLIEAPGDTGIVKLQLAVKNLSDKPAKLSQVRVMVKEGSDLYTKDDWTVSVASRAVAAGGDPTLIRIKVEGVPDGVKVSDLVVDVHGEIADTPDSGWKRVAVKERTLEVRRVSTEKDTPTDLGDKKGPVDIVVVMDTTGSMQEWIDKMRKNAIESIKQLRAKTTDIRVAVTTFRDLQEKADLPHFTVKPFTRDIDAAFAFMDGLTADGGGDTPEDQLHGISLGLALWEKEGKTDRQPTKIIIVVTNAGVHSPDAKGNTFKSIAKRAFEVDPAHIYPIVVGGDPDALEDATQLANDSGGKVITATEPDEIAAAVAAALADATTNYAAPVATTPKAKRSRLWLIGGGVGMVGLAMLVFGVVLGRRRRPTP